MEGSRRIPETTEHKLEEINSLSKHQWKKRVKEAVNDLNRKMILENMDGLKKTNKEKLQDTKFETKKYFYDLDLEQARVAFAIDTNMLKTVKSLYPSIKEYEDNLWVCDQCTKVDSIRHLYRCPFFSDQRNKKQIETNTAHMTAYFQEITNIRLGIGQAQTN